MSKHQMTDKEMLEVVYDILAQNTDMVTESQRTEILERIDHINYDDRSIVFDHEQHDNFTLQGVRL